MRALAAIAILLMLAGCESWSWRDAGRAALYSACYTIANCSASDGDLTSGED